MNNDLKGILAKAFKNEAVNLETGTHSLDETITFHVCGNIEKKSDQFVAPTVSIPWVAAVGLLLEKIGVNGDEAIELLRSAIETAMADGTNTERKIQNSMEDVEAAIKTVRENLLENLPKKRRNGSLIIKGLSVEVVETPEPVNEYIDDFGQYLVTA